MGAFDTVQLRLALSPQVLLEADEKLALSRGDRLEELRNQVRDADVTAPRKPEVFLVEFKEAVQSGVPHTVRHSVPSVTYKRTTWVSR
jgi:hypothetical protein